MRAYQEAPFDAYLNAAELAASVTAADVADFMTRLAAQGNYRVFLLEPQAE
jgi:hypothetical protein